ncbi:MAG TPA: hypothetical protein EYP22_03450 [Methanosarcinales archaeon]|nr:hypothetical protein [Methanosarcinales archaeon]
MEVEEKNIIKSIFEDVKILKWKVEGIEEMLETLTEIYTDAFYEVKEEYLEKLEKIRKKGEFETFSNIEDLRRSIEED